MTFAVIKTGGKQYKVTANDVVKIEKIPGEAGDVVTFDQVLMVGDGDKVTVGAPVVEGALVAGHFIATEKQRTVIILKKQRRQHFDRRNGHRQLLSSVRIAEILTGGKQPTIGPDERLKARAAAKAQGAASVAPDNGAKPKPARKAAKQAASETGAVGETEAAAAAEAKTPATKTAAKKAAPAKKAAAKKTATKAAETAEKKQPAAKKAAAKAPAKTAAKKTPAKKTAPKADKE